LALHELIHFSPMYYYFSEHMKTWTNAQKPPKTLPYHPYAPLRTFLEVVLYLCVPHCQSSHWSDSKQFIQPTLYAHPLRPITTVRSFPPDLTAIAHIAQVIRERDTHPIKRFPLPPLLLHGTWWMESGGIRPLPLTPWWLPDINHFCLSKPLSGVILRAPPLPDSLSIYPSKIWQLRLIPLPPRLRAFDDWSSSAA